MRLILLPTVLACFVFFSCKKNKDTAQDPIPHNQALTWAKTLGGSDYDFAESVTQIQDGSYVMVGSTRSSASGDIAGTRYSYDSWIAKFDNAGNPQWNYAYGADEEDHATGIVASTDGDLLLSGFSFHGADYHAWVMKTNSAGALQWQKQLTVSNDASANAVVAAGDGNYVIAGYTSSGSGRDGWIIKIDPNGNKIWEHTYGGSEEDVITSIVKSPDGGFTVAGYTNSANGDIASGKGNYDGWLMHVDASGNKSWSVDLGGSGEDYLKAVVLSTDGGYVAAGYTKSTNGDIPLNKGGNEEWIVKVDAGGTRQWVKTYGGANEEYVYGLVNTNEGGYITLGYTNSNTGDVFRKENDFDTWLLKLDASGNKVSTSTYGRYPFDDQAKSIIRTQDGGVLLSGTQWIDGKGYDGWLVKIGNF